MLRLARSRPLLVVASVTIGAVLAGGIAWAAQSPVDGNGVVHACYNPSTGAMSLNVKGGPCPVRGQTTPISWNEQGAPGLAGPAGPVGPAGPPGTVASYAFRVYPETDQYILSFLYRHGETVAFTGETFDPDNVFDTTTSSFVAPTDGVYAFGAALRISNGGSTSWQLSLADEGLDPSQPLLAILGEGQGFTQQVQGTAVTALHAGERVQVHMSGQVGVHATNDDYRSDVGAASYFYGYRLSDATPSPTSTSTSTSTTTSLP